MSTDTANGTAQSEAIIRLEALGRRRARLAEQLAKVTEELLDEAIPAAAAVGVPKLRIANAAGVVRQTVYNVLARTEQEEARVLGELRPPETSCVDDGRDPFQGESPTEHDRRL